MKNIIPTDRVFWYQQKTILPPLKGDISCDVVVIGGGMAGLSAAQAFNQRGLSVVLIEKNFCGSGATGKSSGFITPDSELSLDDYERICGFDCAKRIWELANSGVEFIKQNIKKFEIDCDYNEQDTVVLANSEKAYNKIIVHEYNTRLKFGYQSSLYDKDKIKSIIGSDRYSGCIRYGKTFGINSYLYCQAMKLNLQNLGVKIFEDTEAIKIEKNKVQTSNGSIRCEFIIMCCDYFAPELGKLNYDIYHAQTFLMASEPLTDKEINKIFPEQRLMCWDSDLIYQYFRPTNDNRILLGGANLLYTYAKYPKYNSNLMFKKLNNYFKNKFPQIKVNFKYMWPGLIGISKDIMPIAGRDALQPNLYYVTAVAGLPWAAALGNYSAQNLIDGITEFDKIFSPQRNYFIGSFWQKILGRKISFAISNFMQIKSHIA